MLLEKFCTFTVSLKSWKHKGTTVNSQVQKGLDSLLEKRGKFGKCQQEGGFIGAILAATALLWLSISVKGEKRYFIEIVEEFVLIECVDYNQLKGDPTSNVSSENEIVLDVAPGSSVLSAQHLLSAVKNKLGIMYHNKVQQLFEFLKYNPLILTWTDFGEAIVNGTWK